MPASVIAERIGWQRGMTVFNQRVRELRPAYLPPDPSARTSYQPGEVAQFDLWQPAVEIPVGFGQRAKLWVIVGVLGYSRFMAARMIASRQSHDVLAGHLALIEAFGGVPAKRYGTGRGRSVDVAAKRSS
ncbi:MAG: hypothetical protein M3O70_16895 [Actinomycetota bacterium]|nr:hypothetical protein [Actinomycetota bacterium]